MTKLYHGPDGKGWQIPGQQDRKAERLDVPSSPAELAAWLNERAVPATSAPCNTAAGEFENAPSVGELLDAAERAAGNPNRCPECKSQLIVSAAGADKAAISRDIGKIAQWAIGAPVWAIERLVVVFAEEAAALERHAKEGRAH